MTGVPKGFEPRRRKELGAELLARARVALPGWVPSDDDQDFATALFEITARLESEVAERLDRIPEKVFRGFLHWLGVVGDAGRAARLPVVFTMASGVEPVLAQPPIQLQATPAQTDTSVPAEPVTFETEAALMVTPATLAHVIAADPVNDALYLPASAFSTLGPPSPKPDVWKSTSEFPSGTSQIQLEPLLGLEALPTLLHKPSNTQYRVSKADGPLVTIEPALKTAIAQGESFYDSSTFDPFAGVNEANRQEHVLYIGSESVLNVPANARITIGSLASLGTAADWSYWGKLGTDPAIGWQTLKPPDFASGQIVLNKPAGAVEITEIGGKQSRWLRAVSKSKPATGSSVSSLQLTVNCDPGVQQPGCPPGPNERSNVAVEAMANTTPLVLDIPFFPLGREPKLFDAFYLACPEAFSKKNALVQVCLESLDSTTASLVAAQIGNWPQQFKLFGVGHGQLHRLAPTIGAPQSIVRESSVRPPFSDTGIATAPGPPVPLNDVAKGSRLSTVSRFNEVFVAVTAGTAGWLWQQHLLPGQSRWIALGPIHDRTQSAVPPFDPQAPPQLVGLRDGADVRLIGLHKGVLFEARLKPDEQTPAVTWKAVDDGGAGDWARIVPLTPTDDRLRGPDLADGWLAIDDAGNVGVFKTNPSGESVLDSALAYASADQSVAPLALVAPNGSRTLIAAAGPDLVAWSVNNDQEIATLKNVNVTDTFDVFTDQSTVAIVFTSEPANAAKQLAVWFPFGDKNTDPAKAYSASVVLDRANGGPATSADRVVIPGTSGAVISIPFSLDGLTSAVLDATQVESALLIASSTLPAAADDFVESTLSGEDPVVRKLTADAVHSGPSQYWLRLTPAKLHKRFTDALVYRLEVQGEFSGKVKSTSQTKTVIEAQNGDERADEHSHVVVSAGSAPVRSVHEIDSFASGANPGDPWTITLKPPVKNVAVNDPVKYEYVSEGATGSIRPLLDVSAVTADIVAATREQGAYLNGFEPVPNAVMIAHPAAPQSATTLILEDEWTTRPPAAVNQTRLVRNAMFGAASIIEEGQTGNPTVSWEYWDGTAWWKIQGLNDGTGHLQQTGVVEFCVPENLEPTDVAGRTSHWIRARLIAGDYGKESVTIVSTVDPNDPKITRQTVERSLAGIAPPEFVSIDLRYSVCCPAWPDYILTKDANAVRDQTAANRAADAAVEVFVPLTETIRAAASGAESPGDSRRALYLGFDARLQGGPINVMFLVDEGEHDGAFPLEVDVLRERGFERVIASDGTRGLNESGILSFTLPTAPPAVALFGAESRYWLRLRPSGDFDDSRWAPKIRAAFLNGAWAIASETQDLERLGSSDGRPDQRVSLARPPVIKDTLVLRVKEPLSDEEVAELQRTDRSTVIFSLPTPTGADATWVRWRRVDNVSDGGKNERIYELDHVTGEIRFGNGINGKIPPIGFDSIVAVTYKRGGGEAGNRIAAWSQLNLITPIQGVETVIGVDDAAGGSGPQPPETVIRFAPHNLYMRDRALTLSDLESLALQFSPDVAQVRALPARAGARLIVAMRGRDPQPAGAVRRQLGRYLRSKTTPMLAAQGAMTIEGPAVVQVRITLDVAIDTLDSSGAVARDVEAAVRALLDPASGALDQSGWKLGEIPTDADIAAAIEDVAHLEEIHRVEVAEARTNARVPALRPHQLVTLAPEGVIVKMTTIEEGAA